MKIQNTKFKGLKIIIGQKFIDSRGYFRELIKEKIFKKNRFIFWCMSKSKKNVIRGLHFQKKNQQEKIVSVIKGSVLDIAVDLRRNSKYFGQYFKIKLSEKNCKSILIPKGFAHGFLGLELENIIVYGNTNYRSKKDEIGLLWNDRDLAIRWPKKKMIVSKKDNELANFSEFKKKFKYL